MNEKKPLNRAVEKYYTVNEVSLLFSVSTHWVRRRVSDGAFGEGVVDLSNGTFEHGRDIRIPASGINSFLDRHRLSREAPSGIAARSIGELRRKSKVQTSGPEG